MKGLKLSRELHKLKRHFAAKWPLLTTKKVPVALYFDFFAAARQGISPRLFIEDPAVKRNAVIKTFLETGADGFVIGRLPSPFSYAAGGFPNCIHLPGCDLPEHSMWQFEESKETIFVDDYDFIATYGWNRFLARLLPRFTNFRAVELPELFQRSKEEGARDLAAWRQKNIPLMCGAAVTAPFEVLCAGRTMFKFFEDLIIRPEQVINALEGMVSDFIEGAIEAARFYGIPAVVITAHRSGGNLISPRHFEQFALPFLRKMIDMFYRAEINVMLHLDCDWTENLPYLRDFPCGLIMHTDGSTDLTRAGNLLKDNFILMGDVPAPILARGSPEEVEEYCINLIEKIGSESQLILSSGCDVPMDAGIENVRAMVRVANRL